MGKGKGTLSTTISQKGAFSPPKPHLNPFLCQDPYECDSAEDPSPGESTFRESSFSFPCSQRNLRLPAYSPSPASSLQPAIRWHTEAKGSADTVTDPAEGEHLSFPLSLTPHCLPSSLSTSPTSGKTPGFTIQDPYSPLVSCVSSHRSLHFSKTASSSAKWIITYGLSQPHRITVRTEGGSPCES